MFHAPSIKHPFHTAQSRINPQLWVRAYSIFVVKHPRVPAPKQIPKTDPKHDTSLRWDPKHNASLGRDPKHDHQGLQAALGPLEPLTSHWAGAVQTSLSENVLHRDVAEVSCDQSTPVVSSIFLLKTWTQKAESDPTASCFSSTWALLTRPRMLQLPQGPAAGSSRVMTEPPKRNFSLFPTCCVYKCLPTFPPE